MGILDFVFNRPKRLKPPNELLKNALALLPEEYDYLRGQFNEGIIESVYLEETFYTGNYKCSLNVALLNKYEDKSGRNFELCGIEVFDETLKEWAAFTIHIGYGLMLSYRTNMANPGSDKVRINQLRKVFLDRDFISSLSIILTGEDLKLINFANVYDLELDGKLYYHLKDLEDGDFIAVDNKGNPFKITHDPYELNPIPSGLNSVLSGK